ncbi:MAG: hypothetical protein U1E08_08545 [Coriobacteriia bacterium]|nr:hypothetical protein [Coriobacteriia bacterium]
METRPGRMVSSIAAGAAFPTLALALAASAPLVNNRFITPIDGRILVITWWFVVPLGVALAVLRSRRLWPGVVVGAWSAVAFQLSLMLVTPVAERSDMALSPTSLLGAVAVLAAPWAIGMILGWNSVTRRPMRRDGVPRDGESSG